MKSLCATFGFYLFVFIISVKGALFFGWLVGWTVRFAMSVSFAGPLDSDRRVGCAVSGI